MRKPDKSDFPTDCTTVAANEKPVNVTSHGAEARYCKMNPCIHFQKNLYDTVQRGTF